MAAIGLRYFNIFGPRQDPKGAYAAVIPLWFSAMIKKSPVYINGDGEVNEADANQMETVLKGYIDVNGDSVIDGDDSVFIQKTIEFLAYGVTEYEKQIGDINGDGRVTPDDEYRISQLVGVFKNGDVNGDSYITWDDLAELNFVISFLENVQTYLPEVVERADINGDGVVD